MELLPRSQVPGAHQKAARKILGNPGQTWRCLFQTKLTVYSNETQEQHEGKAQILNTTSSLFVKCSFQQSMQCNFLNFTFMPTLLAKWIFHDGQTLRPSKFLG